MLIWLSVASLLVGVLLSIRARGTSLTQVAAVLVLPWLLALAVLDWVHVWLASPWDNWTSGRLAPMVGMLNGYDLYCTQDAGTIQTTMYPPGSYLAFLPAGLFRSPTAIILAASALNLVFVCLGPIALFKATAETGRRALTLTLLGSATFLLVGALLYPVSYHLAHVHADSPALFFAMLACFFVFRYRAGSRWSLWAAAACLCASIWCKQTMVMCALALPAYLWWLHGSRAATRLVGRLAVLGLSTLALALLVIGPEALIFHTISLPSSFEPRPTGLWGAARVFIRHGWPTLVGVGLAFGLKLVLMRRREYTLRHWARDDASLLLFFTALVLTPISLMGQAKYGGDVNSFHNLYFLQAAVICVMIAGARSTPELGARIAFTRLCSLAMILLPLGLAATVATSLVDQSLKKPWDKLYANPQQVAYEYTLKNPGQIWFPWNPLSNLLAEGRLDHMDRAVDDWKVAGEKVSAERLLATIPSSVKALAYPPGPKRGLGWTLGEFLAGRRRMTQIRTLPGWRAYLLPDR